MFVMNVLGTGDRHGFPYLVVPGKSEEYGLNKLWLDREKFGVEWDGISAMLDKGLDVWIVGEATLEETGEAFCSYHKWVVRDIRSVCLNEEDAFHAFKQNGGSAA